MGSFLILDALRGAIDHSYTVTSYVNPDMDGVACILGIYELLKRHRVPCEMAISGKPSPDAVLMLRRLGITLPVFETDSSTSIILVDVSSPEGLDCKLSPQQVVLVIDHRVITRNLFTSAALKIDFVGSVSTLIAEAFFYDNLQPSKEVAFALLAGIAKKTLALQKNATQRDYDMFFRLAKFVEPEYGLVKNLIEVGFDFLQLSTKNIPFDQQFLLEEGKSILSLQMEVGSLSFALGSMPELLRQLIYVKEKENAHLAFLSVLGVSEGEEGKTALLFVTDEEKRFFYSLLEGAYETIQYPEIIFCDRLIFREELLSKVQTALIRTT